MTKILKAEEFIKESLGAKIKDRNLNRFNSDKLANKEEGEIMERQYERFFDGAMELIENKLANNPDANIGKLSEVDTFSGYITVQFNIAGDLDNIKTNANFTKETPLNNSQQNVLDRMGMWVGSENGLAFVDKIEEFQMWILNSKTFKKYKWVLTYEAPVVVSLADLNDPESDAVLNVNFETSPEDTTNPFNTANPFYPYGKKEQEEFANTVVGFFADLRREIEENIQRIF